MTDYASQGKTRAYNVVELSESKNFQAIYTALSRSSTAAHTYILGDLNKRQIDKVSQGLTKLQYEDYRLEMQQLNTLDLITAEKHYGHWPNSISEGMRNPLIKAFVDRCKGEGINFTQDWHPAIQLNNILDLVAKPANDQASSLWDSKVAREVFKEGQDRLAKRSPLTSEGGKEDKKQRKVKGNVTKTKRSDAEEGTRGVEEGNTPKRCMVQPTNLAVETPKGIIWDGANYSCAYDALTVILYNMWSTDIAFWTAAFNSLNSDVMNQTMDGFRRVANGAGSLESARDGMRRLLHHRYPTNFPYGASFIYLSDLIAKLPLSDVNVEMGSTCLHCGNCRLYYEEQYLTLQGTTEVTRNRFRETQCGGRCSMAEALYLDGAPVRKTCEMCMGTLDREMHVVGDMPELMTFSVDAMAALTPCLSLILDGNEYRLRGMIYGGRNHFTCRIIDKHGQVWYFDGMAKPGAAVFERVVTLQEDLEWLCTVDDRKLMYLLYTNETKRNVFDHARTARQRRVRRQINNA
jgi:hypothetical protein